MFKGSPVVVLKNSRLQKLDVHIEALSQQEYKCTYTVENPGTEPKFGETYYPPFE